MKFFRFYRISRAVFFPNPVRKALNELINFRREVFDHRENLVCDALAVGIGLYGVGAQAEFSEFETEKNFDTVQILGGGRTESTAVNIATLSGTDPGDITRR